MDNRHIVRGIKIQITLFLNQKSYAKFTAKVLDYRYFIPRHLSSKTTHPTHAFKVQIVFVEYNKPEYIVIKAGDVITISDEFHYDMRMIEKVEDYNALFKQKRKEFEYVSTKCFNIRMMISKLTQDF